MKLQKGGENENQLKTKIDEGILLLFCWYYYFIIILKVQGLNFALGKI